MTLAYFAIGTTLANMVNVESIISLPPSTTDGGARMPLQGGVAKRLLSKKLQRSGDANAAWMWPYFENDQTDLDTLQLFIFGDFTTSSKSMYVTTQDERGKYSPFLVYIDAPYEGVSKASVNDVPYYVRFDLSGGILQYLDKSANYTVTLGDHYINLDTSGGSRTLALPAVATVVPNVIYTAVKTSASNSLIIDPSGAETISGASTLTKTALNARVDYYTPDNLVWLTL